MLSTTFFYALLSGMLPSLLWLFFWLREDNLHPEPKKLIAATFAGGAVAVALAIPIQQYLSTVFADSGVRYVVWAATEELLKFTITYFIVMRSRYFDEPIDAMIYMITAALGFSAIENSLFIFKPLMFGHLMQAITTGNLRFMGATLLHTVSSAAIGLFIALAYYKKPTQRVLLLSLGMIVAILLHSTFNLFIINTNGADTILVFGCVWAAVVLLILFFEKVKQVEPVEIESRA